jgi:preprotein translocase subunit SecF
LFIGIIVGTYSTIFVAAPLYALFREKEPKYATAEAKVLASR